MSRREIAMIVEGLEDGDRLRLVYELEGDWVVAEVTFRSLHKSIAGTWVIEVDDHRERLAFGLPEIVSVEKKVRQ